ncbi:MAG: glycoside hydrolase family 2 [Clostridia bacterium]|nr:glycoside hydrolase family 2 [Clostridia bacterium]
MRCYIKDYPRPQFVRKDWENLNGEWNFIFDDSNEGERKKYFLNFPNSNKIKVPFTYETKLSGLADESIHYIVWYNRKINISKEIFQYKKVILNFEGSDYKTKIWINGNYIGENVGAYSRFSFDIEKYIIDGENDITVKVEDSLSKDQPRGKQRYKKENWKCWYIQTTGIWKTVWIEIVSKKYIKNVKITPKIEQVQLEIETNLSENDIENQNYYIETLISFDGQILNKTKEIINNNYYKSEMNIVAEEIQHIVKKWSMNAPNLYDITYRLYCEDKVIDTVDSYFGIREISIKGNKIYLNEEELYLKLILDQGYWKESHLTPPNEQSLVSDIESVLALGYNGIRKHQKVEDERFLYWCDVKGVLVWSEMANCYSFNDKSLQNFTNEWIKVVKQNYNHPSIITWVPINESWGVPEVSTSKKQQDFINALYYLTKGIDDTRPVISNDGWEHTISDIITIHDYRQDDELLYQEYTDKEMKVLNNLKEYNGKHRLFSNRYKYEGQPVIISEYGGIAINSEEGWGYGKQVKDEKELIERFTKLTKLIYNIPYICGYCYTQLTDVQQEVNGLMDPERNYKVQSNIIKNINNKGNIKC